jgi:hypothetical protein
VPNRDERSLAEVHTQIGITTAGVQRIPSFNIGFGGILIACSALNRFGKVISTGIYA